MKITSGARPFPVAATSKTGNAQVNTDAPGKLWLAAPGDGCTPLDRLREITRRHFFSQCAVGLGSIALSSLLSEQRSFGAELKLINPLTPKAPHFPARAKNIIYLFMAGGPSQL